MCTQPHPLIVYSIFGEVKRGTIFFSCFPDELVLTNPLSYTKDYVFRKYSIPGTMVKNAELYTVPCGQCYQCRLQYSRMWANRCVCESLLYDPDSCYFVTLTYDNDHLDTILTKEGTLTLNFDDLQKFLKRLRRYYEYHYGVNEIRFFAAGEYGDKNMRPHFHILLYNCKIPDKEQVACNTFGDPLYASDIFSSLWPFGFVCIGGFSWNTAAYTARYCMKKIKGVGAEYYQDLGIIPEATRMSRRPGIGADYVLENFDNIYRRLEDDEPLVNSLTGEVFDERYYDRIILPAVGHKPMMCKPGRFMDNVAKQIDPDRVDRVKQMRSVFAQIKQENEKAEIMKSDREYFGDVDYVLNSKKKGMYRKFLDLC